MNLTFETVIDNYQYSSSYEPVEDTNTGETGFLFVLDRLAKDNELTEQDENNLSQMGARSGVRHYRYAPELKEQYFYIPDTAIKWACPDCSDVYFNNPVILDYHGRVAWTCPKCGCGTNAPREDACEPLFYMLETGC